MREVWIKILHWPYEVSNLGRVRRVTTKGYRYLRGGPDKDGYYLVHFRDGPTRSQEFRRARLILETFRGPPPGPAYTTGHKDGTVDNDALKNLYWATSGDQIADRRRHGTIHCGEHHPMAKLDWDKVREIRRRYVPGCPINGGRALAVEFGINKGRISKIIHRKLWVE